MMLESWYDDVAAFHGKFGPTYDGPPRQLPDDLRRFRYARLVEEVHEYLDATTLVGKLDAVIDTVYVAFGNAYLHGFNEARHVRLMAPRPSFVPHRLFEPHDYVRHRDLLVVSLYGAAYGATLDETRCSLDELVRKAVYAARAHGFADVCLVEAWRRVHAANLRKVKVDHPESSRFGSGYDVVKPEGWTAPVLDDLVWS